MSIDVAAHRRSAIRVAAFDAAERLMCDCRWVLVSHGTTRTEMLHEDDCPAAGVVPVLVAPSSKVCKRRRRT